MWTREHLFDLAQRYVGTKEVGGKVRHEDFGALGGILNAQTNGKWHAKVDWEWRTKWELDGSIEKLPLLKKWLVRARGPVMVKKPDGD